MLRVRAKVQLVSDEAMEKAEPARQATVEITLNDGTVLSDHVTDVRGTVDNPMTREEVADGNQRTAAFVARNTEIPQDDSSRTTTE